MSSNPTWKRDANGVEHPTHEMLLACIREQCSEQEKSRVSEHLLAGCASCERTHTGFTQDSRTLNQLKDMSRYLYYPELQAGKILLHAQRGEPLTSAWTGKRKSKFQVQGRPAGKPQASGRYTRRTGLRFISIPAAFALFILFAVLLATLVYALVNMGKFSFSLPGRPTNSIYRNQVPDTNGISEHQVTPTSAVPAASVSPTPATFIEGAVITSCPPTQYSGSAIYICGYGFKTVDKVWLVVSYDGGTSSRTLGPYKVNRDGKFKVTWSISCKNSPVTLYAANKMQQPLAATLENIARDGCSGHKSGV